jgi:hypothetical protein
MIKRFLQYLREQEEELKDKDIARRFAHPVRDKSGKLVAVRYRLVRGTDVANRGIHSHLIDREGNRVQVNAGEGYSPLGLRIGKVVRRTADQLGHDITGGDYGKTQLIQFGTPVPDSDEVHITIPVKTKVDVTEIFQPKIDPVQSHPKNLLKL